MFIRVDLSARRMKSKTGTNLLQFALQRSLIGRTKVITSVLLLIVSNGIVNDGHVTLKDCY